MRNIMIIGSETTLIYNTTLSCDEVKIWYERECEDTVSDIFYITQEELQYYCIDGRVWMDEEKDKRVVAKIAAYQ